MEKTYSKELIVDNYYIEADPKTILEKLRGELKNGKLSQINYGRDSIKITCPVHKGGREQRPSCFINLDPDKAPYLWAHCFTCDLSCSFEEFVAHSLDVPVKVAKRWLIENFGTGFVKRELKIDDITLDKEEEQYLADSVLENFSSYHPYMSKRGLTEETIQKFELKYDPEYKAIVFPVRDSKGHLVALNRRSVEKKKFWIQKDFDKSCLYLLYNILKDNLKEVVICEGQFDALMSWQYGHPAICLYGAGTTDEQMKVLNNTGIKHYFLCYDNDPAGRAGAERFKKLIRKDVFVDDIVMPLGKDIATLTKEEFEELLKN